MRPTLIIAAAGALVVGACATAGGETVTTTAYQQDLDRLRATCDARNGVLWPLQRRTGFAATDYECRYLGGTNPYALRP